MMLTHRPRRVATRWWTLLAAVPVFGCSLDTTCTIPPCPLRFAAEITVTAVNSTAPVPGLIVSVNGTTLGPGNCVSGSGAQTVCEMPGGPGSYSVQVSAPGYRSSTVTVAVTGTSEGCNTCGEVDEQHVAVVLQPA